MPTPIMPLRRVSSDRIRIYRRISFWSASCPCCRMEEYLPTFDLARAWAYLHLSQFHRKAG